MTTILDRAVPNIEQRTPQWLALRRTGIGGSDAPAVLGLSPWVTPYAVWADKTGDAGAFSPDSEAMIWGRVLEAAILGEYRRRTGLPTVGVGLLRHPNLSWLICSPDAIIPQNDAIIEIKTARHGAGWGAEGTDDIPLHYLVQVHHNLIVSGAARADVAVLIAGNEYRLYHVEPDPDLHSQMLDQETSFWRSVQTRDPPPPKNFADAMRRWGRAARPGSVVATRELVTAVEVLHQIHASIKEGEAHSDELKMEIMAALGDDGDTLVNDSGTVLATWRLDRGRAGYMVEPKEPTRRFLLKG